MPVRLSVETAYPFDGAIKLSVSTTQAVSFPIHLRIPAWAEGANVQVGNDAPQAAQAGLFWTLEREWTGETQLILRLPLELRVTRRYNDSVSLYRGPLLYGLKIREIWQQLRASYRTPTGRFTRPAGGIMGWN